MTSRMPLTAILKDLFINLKTFSKATTNLTSPSASPSTGHLDLVSRMQERLHGKCPHDMQGLSIENFVISATGGRDLLNPWGKF